MDSGFQSVLLEGVFYHKPDGLWVSHTTSEIQVSQELQPLLGQVVQAAIHFNPPLPIDQHLWGGGCCLWQPSGHCPVGHHANPGLMLNIAGHGVLCREGSDWQLRLDSGVLLDLRLSLLDGHHARIVMVSDCESPTQDVSDLEGEATRLREILTRLGGMLGRGV